MQGVSKRDVFYAALATAAEYYDFTLFAYVSVYVAANFFPADDSATALLASFGIFASGYIMRPLGGIVLGNLGDRYGRRAVLIAALFMMMLAVGIIAVVPTAAVIGTPAVILMVIARMLQGFSIGGEYNGVLALLIEQAPAHKRASVTSWGTFIEGNGCLLSTVVVFLCTWWLTPEQMRAFGWRIPYYVGFVLCVAAFVAMIRLRESRVFEAAARADQLETLPVWVALKRFPGRIFQVFCLAGYLGIAYYMAAAFIPAFLISEHGASEFTTMGITMVAAICYAYSAPLWGQLSDKVGRRPMLLASAALLALMAYPMFWLLTLDALWGAALAYCVMMLVIAAGTATFVTAINELFPAHLRFSGVATGYNVSNAVFGGTTPLVSGTLVSLTAWQLAPGMYLVAASVLIIAVVVWMPETRGIDLEL